MTTSTIKDLPNKGARDLQFFFLIELKNADLPCGDVNYREIKFNNQNHKLRQRKLWRHEQFVCQDQLTN